MGAYDNDRRVVRLSNGDYMIAWTIRRTGERWAAYNHDGDLDETIGLHDDPDPAVAGVIGAPR